MNTDSNGATTSINAANGSKAYWKEHGYSLNVDGWSNFSNYQNEIDNYRRAIISVWKDKTPGLNYGDHALTGIGYQILDNGQRNAIVRDSWHSQPTDVIYPYGNYVQIVQSFVPEPI